MLQRAMLEYMDEHARMIAENNQLRRRLAAAEAAARAAEAAARAARAAMQRGECAICMAPVEPRRAGECRRLRCKHEFHEQCIATWFQRSKTCPMCRARCC